MRHGYFYVNIIVYGKSGGGVYGFFSGDRNMQLILIKDGKKIMSTGRAVVKTAEEIIWYDSKNVLSIKFDVKREEMKICLNSIKS